MSENLAALPDQAIFRQIFEASSDGIAVVESGNLLHANRAARALYGLALERLLGSGRVYGADLDAFREQLRGGARAFVELQIPDGRRGRRVTLHGEMLGRYEVLFLRDVTEQRRVEEELCDARRLESVGYITACVVHDFNNLLTPILCLSSALVRTLDDGPQSLAREIATAAERAAGLVRQVLSFARRGSAPPERVSLNAAVAEMSALIERMAGETIEVRLSLDAALGDTIADRMQLEHVLLNLTANARDAMPRGGRLTIATANVTLGEREAEALRCAGSGAFVALTVTDEGGGMSPQIRARLFERFFTTKDLGTGLGLATAHRFVEQNGGCISVRSEPGEGTTVVVYLPRVAPALHEASPARPAEQAWGGSESILVVDDDAQVRRAARAVLEEHGYRVLDAASAERALEEAERPGNAIDLVLVDVVMPGTSGPALVARLRALGRPVRALFMSGHGDEVLEEHDVRLGRELLLRKAFAPHELASKVREALGPPRPRSV